MPTYNDSVTGVTFDINQGATRKQVSELAKAVNNMSPSDIFRSQPTVHAVIDFIARNVAQLGLHSYRLLDNNDRKRDRDSIIAKILKSPSPAQTQYELIYSLVADLMLFDEAYIWVAKSDKHKTGYILRPIPVHSIESFDGDEFMGDMSIRIAFGEDAKGNQKYKTLKQEELIHLHGWTPDYDGRGIPPVESLKQILIEQSCAEGYRTAVWKNAGHMSAYISRPKDAPGWTPETQERFKREMEEYKQGGAKQGGMPVIEDGMTINSTHMNATEEQYIEVAELSFKTICRVYHVNPAQLGDSGGVTYANMREFSKSLYKETLGPTLAKVEQKLNSRLVEILATRADPLEDLYLEFNIKAKLAGDFHEEAEVLYQSAGTAFMTVNEVRATQNLPAVDGGDVLVRPLNIGTALEEPEGPSDALEEPKSAPVASVAYKAPKNRVEATPAESESGHKKLEALFERYAKRQKSVVLSKLGTKADEDWWDAERWDKELTDDLYRLALSITNQIGGQVAADLGFSGVYDREVTAKFLLAVASSRAQMINETTRQAVVEALKADSEVEPTDVFDSLADERGIQASTTLYSTLAAFSAVEAGKQVAREATPNGSAPARSTKTWVVNSGNPRTSHSMMDGETVGIEEKFSNGASWPGDPVLGADGVAGCMCSVEVSVEID